MRPNVFEGKFCLITGATGGCGHAVARLMASAGCHLVVTSRSREKLRRLEAELRGLTSPTASLQSIVCDFADGDSLESMVSRVKETPGRTDIVINCAGVFSTKPIIESGLRDYEECFNVNVRAPFLLMRAFLPAMIENRWGRIVNIGSSSSYAGFKDSALYCASKHALLGLSRSAFAEAKDDNVRIYCVSPGSIKTEMGRDVPRQDYETFIEPHEVAEYIHFIMSFDSNLITEEIRLNRMHVR